MAKAADTSKQRLGRYDVTIDGDRYHNVLITLAQGYATTPAEAQMAGAVPLGQIVAGATITGAIHFTESDSGIREALLDIASALPLAIGEQMPTHAVVIHDPADGATTTGDISIPKAVFGQIQDDGNDGKTTRKLVCAFAGMYDATCDGAWKLLGA